MNKKEKTRLVIMDGGETTEGQDTVHIEVVGKRDDIIDLLLHTMGSEEHIASLIMAAASIFMISGDDVIEHMKEHSKSVRKMGGKN